MAQIGEKYNIELFSCCDSSVEVAEVERGRCVDYPHMKGVFGGHPTGLKVRPTRKGCRCYHSIDIGSYGSCLHGCFYCYAS